MRELILIKFGWSNVTFVVCVEVVCTDGVVWHGGALFCDTVYIGVYRWSCVAWWSDIGFCCWSFTSVIVRT